MIELDDLLQKLELLIRNGKKSVFSNTVSVNPDDVYRIITAIRNNLPEMMQEANIIVAKKDEILKDEKRRAELYIQSVERKGEEIINNARAEASKLISEAEILRQAEAEAKSIKEEAADWSRNTQISTRNNVIKMFEDASSVLEESLKQTNGAINYLKSLNKDVNQ